MSFQFPIKRNFPPPCNSYIANTSFGWARVCGYTPGSDCDSCILKKDVTKGNIDPRTGRRFKTWRWIGFVKKECGVGQ